MNIKHAKFNINTISKTLFHENIDINYYQNVCNLIPLVDVNFAVSVCSPENRETPDGLDTCVQTIRDTMVDISAFWFGSDYPEKCPVPEYTIECQNFNPTPASMADRLFTPGTFDASAIETFIEVTVHEKSGRLINLVDQLFYSEKWNF